MMNVADVKDGEVYWHKVRQAHIRVTKNPNGAIGGELLEEGVNNSAGTGKDPIGYAFAQGAISAHYLEPAKKTFGQPTPPAATPKPPIEIGKIYNAPFIGQVVKVLELRPDGSYLCEANGLMYLLHAEFLFPAVAQLPAPPASDEPPARIKPQWGHAQYDLDACAHATSTIARGL